MDGIESRIKNILENLEQVNEDLMALSDDIWLSIDHNDNDAIKEGIQFKAAYNNQLTEFNTLSSNISKLVQEFTGTSPEHEEAEQENSKENERIIKELDKREKHYLTEDLTYKRPYGFSFKGKAYRNVHVWKKVYELLLKQLEKNEPGFSRLTSDSRFISNRGNKSFSKSENDLRSPLKINNNFYAETNLSANHISNAILKLLDVFGYSEEDFIVYLREDRDFKAK